MLIIDNKIDTRSIEKAYRTFKDVGNSTVDLKITKKFSSDFGVVPAIIQLISTWHLKVNNGKIIIEATENKVDEFYSFDYFFPSIIYCWAREIVDTSGKDLKPSLREQNIVYHEKMRRQSTGGGPKALLSCFDHLSAKKGLLNSFYVDGEFLENEILFGAAIDKVLKHVTSFNQTLSKKNLPRIYLDLIDIIYELVKNTDNWATTDQNNKPLNPSTRGLFLKFHKKQQATLLAEFNEQEGIRRYFSDKFIKNKQNEIYFLELSVYDTGVGYVNRYKPKLDGSYLPEEQVDIVKECLLRNNTSATGRSKMVKGKGLDRIMNILDDKGFFWIRTGNVSVYRNLRENRHQTGSTKEEIRLFDWLKGSDSNFSDLEYGQGSVVTLVYPLSEFEI